MKLSFPPTAMEKHRAAVDAALLRMVPDVKNSLRALLLGGSIAAGKAHESSDVDLFILADIAWFQRLRLVIDDVPVDIFIDSPTRVEEQINAHNAVYVRNFATGWMLWDPSSIASRLKRAANVIIVSPRRPIDENFAFSLRNRTKDLLEDLRRAVDTDKDTARYVISSLVPWGYHALYRIQRRWDVPAKRLLSDVATFAPEIRRMGDKLLAEDTPMGDRLLLAEEFANAIFGDSLSPGDDIGPQQNKSAAATKPSRGVQIRVGDKLLDIREEG